MNKANDLGDNWIRSAISEILDRDQAGFPLKEILAFLKADQNTGSSRKFAFEIIQEYKPKLAQSLAPKFIDDREPTLRRLAVEKLLESARRSGKARKIESSFRKSPEQRTRSRPNQGGKGGLGESRSKNRRPNPDGVSLSTGIRSGLSTIRAGRVSG